MKNLKIILAQTWHTSRYWATQSIGVFRNLKMVARGGGIFKVYIFKSVQILA